MSMSAVYQLFCETALPRWRETGPSSLLRAELAAPVVFWMHRLYEATGIQPEEVVHDAACCGSLCVRAAQGRLRVGLETPDGEFVDYTEVTGNPMPEPTGVLVNALIPYGVRRTIEDTQRFGSRIVNDGMNLLAIAAAGRGRLVITDPIVEPGGPSRVPPGERYRLAFHRDYSNAPPFAVYGVGVLKNA